MKKQNKKINIFQILQITLIVLVLAFIIMTIVVQLVSPDSELGKWFILNVWDLTYYAFQDQLRRMSWREEFDINTRASLAGAKLDKKKLSHWIKSMTFN